MGSGGGKTGGGSGKTYYGTIAGVVCAGPVDELVSLIIDGATVWPTTRFWADGIIDLPVLWVERKANGRAKLGFATPHTLKEGQKFVLSGFADPSFNFSEPVSVADKNDRIVKFDTSGDVVPQTYVTAGTLTKVVRYESGDLVADGGGIWSAKTDHWGTPATRPPAPAFWDPYVVSRQANPNPYPLTVPKFGQVYFYWGTDDQVLDAVGEAVLAGAGHPPYRRQALLVLKDFYFGPSREQSPNVEVVVRRKPAQQLVEGVAAELDAESQANPIACMAEWLQEPVFGLGAGVVIRRASWQALADALQADATRACVSPIVDRPETARSLLAGMLAYYDGWLRFSDQGWIEAGRFVHGEEPPSFTPQTTIGYHDLVGEIAWDADGWASTFSKTVCRFQDRARAFKGAGQTYISGMNQAAVGESRLATLERPWITRQPQAASHAAEWGKINAQPSLAGKLELRAERAAAIRPGDLFLLTHDGLQFSVVCRCMGKTIAAPPAGKVTLRFASERGTAPLPYHPTDEADAQPQEPAVERVVSRQLLQAPPAMVAGASFRLCVLAARSSDLTMGMRVWLRVDDEDLFYDLGEQRAWAVMGYLTQDYAEDLPEPDTTPPDDDTETLQCELSEFTVRADLERLSATQSDDAINDHAVLVVLVTLEAPAVFEVCTLKALRLDGGVYKLKVRRARFGTSQRAFTVGDAVWIVERKAVVGYAHEKFAAYAQAAEIATFRLQGFTARQEADLADADVCPDITFQFADPYAPAVNWTLLQKDGADISDFSASFLPTDTFTFELQITAPGAGLIAASLVARLGSIERTLWSGSFPPSAQQIKMTSFKLDTIGAWNLYCIARDASGRVTQAELRPVGGGAPVQLIIADGNTVSTPYGPVGGGVPSRTVNVSLSCATAVATIYYQIVAPGGSLSPTWTTYVGPFTIVSLSQRNPHTLYAYASKSGMDDSAVVSWSFWYETS